MASKRHNTYNDSDLLKIFLFTYEEYLKISSCFADINKTNTISDGSYVFLQTKLVMIRKYEDIGDPVYLRNVLDAAKNTYSDQLSSINKIIQRIDQIENSQFEIYLSDGTERDLHEAIEDVIYGLYLHADKKKIEMLIKTNMATYMFAVEKYVTFWEEILNDSYDLINGVTADKYSREEFERASIIFVGTDNTQEKSIKSAPYWSNLRGRDALPSEADNVLEQLSEEERDILFLVTSFLEELKKPEYSKKVLLGMIHPVVKSYWGDFRSIHDEISDLKMGYSNKVRFNDEHDCAYVLIFNHFSPDGLIVINQPQYAEDIAKIYLKKDSEKTGWKIVSMNVEPEKLIKTVRIAPGFFLHRIFKQIKKD